MHDLPRIFILVLLSFFSFCIRINEILDIAIQHFKQCFQVDTVVYSISGQTLEFVLLIAYVLHEIYAVIREVIGKFVGFEVHKVNEFENNNFGYFLNFDNFGEED